MDLFEKKEDKLSAFVKATLGLLVTATLDSVVAFSTAYWATWSSHELRQHGGYGLWKLWRCHLETERHDTRELSLKGLTLSEEFMKDTLGCHIKMADASFPAWYVVSQVFQTVGLAALVASLVLLFIIIFMPQLRRCQKMIRAIVGVSYFAGGCHAVSLFVFGFKVAEEIADLRPDDWALSWSFSLSCIGCLLTQIAASVMVTESKHMLSGKSPSYAEEDILPLTLPDQDKLLDFPDYQQQQGNRQKHTETLKTSLGRILET